MLKFRFLVILLSAIVFISACQPTPEKEIVVNKGNTKAEEIITASKNNNASESLPSASVGEETERFSYEYVSQNGKYKISIDAELSLPQTSQFPVVTVEPIPFKSEQLKKIAEILFQGNKPYQENDILSKSDIEAEIVALKRVISGFEQGLDIENLDENGQPIEVDQEIASNGIETCNELLEELGRQYNDAPEYVEQEPIDWANVESVEKTDGIFQISAKGQINDNLTGSLYVTTDTESGNNRLLFTVDDGMLEYDRIPVTEKANGLNMSLDEAAAEAYSFIQTLGLGYMVQSGVCKSIIYDEAKGDISDVPRDSLPECFSFTFTRSVQDVPVTCIYGYSTEQATDSEAPPKYVDSWTPEKIEVSVYGDGVKKIDWFSPVIETEVVNSNVKILSFEDVEDILKRQIGYIAEGNSQTINDEINIRIHKIALGMAFVVEKDNRTTRRMIPVWDLFAQDSSNEVEYSAMTINAIDGSVIDRGLGY